MVEDSLCPRTPETIVPILDPENEVEDETFRRVVSDALVVWMLLDVLDGVACWVVNETSVLLPEIEPVTLPMAAVGTA